MDECVESDYLNSRPCMSHADACEHDYVCSFLKLWAHGRLYTPRACMYVTTRLRALTTGTRTPCEFHIIAMYIALGQRKAKWCVFIVCDDWKLQFHGVLNFAWRWCIHGVADRRHVEMGTMPVCETWSPCRWCGVAHQLSRTICPCGTPLTRSALPHGGVNINSELP